MTIINSFHACHKISHSKQFVRFGWMTRYLVFMLFSFSIQSLTSVTNGKYFCHVIRLTKTLACLKTICGTTFSLSNSECRNSSIWYHVPEFINFLKNFTAFYATKKKNGFELWSFLTRLCRIYLSMSRVLGTWIFFLNLIDKTFSFNF